jgi:D-aminoacyl-tRNA deacylase
MRAVLQRVKEARVEVDGRITGAIGPGIVVLLGLARWDTESDAEYLVEKISNLRIFHDENGKMNRNVREAQGGLLLVSQFTLYGDCSRGRRPSFDDAAPAAQARLLYEYFVARAAQTGIPVATGIFQASMALHLENDGPVTLICESPSRK